MKKIKFENSILLISTLVIVIIFFNFLIKANFNLNYNQTDEENAKGGPLFYTLDSALVNAHYLVVLEENLSSNYAPKVEIGSLPVGLELAINNENKLEIVGIPEEVGNYLFHITYDDDNKKAYSISVFNSEQNFSELTSKLNYFHICDYVALSNDEKLNQKYKGAVSSAYFKVRGDSYYLVNNDCEIEVLINDKTNFSPPADCISGNCFKIYENQALLLSLSKSESSLDFYLRSAEIIDKDHRAYKFFIDNNLGLVSIGHILSQANYYLNKKFELSAYLKAVDQWTFYLHDDKYQIEVLPWVPIFVAQCPPEMNCDIPTSMGHFVNKKLNLLAELKQKEPINYADKSGPAYFIDVLEANIIEEASNELKNNFGIKSNSDFIACDDLRVANDINLENIVRDNCFMMLSNSLNNIEACYFINDLELKKNCYQNFQACEIVDNQILIDDCKLAIAGSIENTNNWEAGRFIDARDKQEYPWVKIGEQVWMAKNLNYNSGCLDNNWENREETSWCGYYNHDKDKYYDWGIMYQWSAAMNNETKEGAQGVCPDGWRVPSDNDFKNLEAFLGIARNELSVIGWREFGQIGKKLKSSNWNGTNDYGFSLLPMGFKYSGGSFHESDYGSASFMTNIYNQNFINLLSSSLVDIEDPTQGHWFRSIGDDDGIYRNFTSYGSASYLRCIKN
jgi:uncharacterized protein (TIGR02145 family)